MLITETLKKAIDDIYRYPLRERAKESLVRQIKLEIPDDELIRLVTALYEDNNLVFKNENENQNNEPQIICSMGIVNNQTEK